MAVDPDLVSVKNEKPDLRKKEPPLVDVTVTNPLVYIKSWWKKIIGNEGIDFRLRVKPLTAIAITVIVATISFGIGRFVFPFKIPFFEYTLKENQQLKQLLSRDTAFAGNLRYDQSTAKYFLITGSSEAINLTIPNNIDLSKFVGKRIFATGKFDSETNTLQVVSASDMEILPTESIKIPTEVPTIYMEPTTF